MCRSDDSNIFLVMVAIKQPRVQAVMNRSDKHLPRTMLSCLRDAGVLALKRSLPVLHSIGF